MRKVSHHMGMPISIDIPECLDPIEFNEYWNILAQIDNQYSPYINTSEVTQIALGTINPNVASNELQEIISVAKVYEKKTEGYFSVYYSGGFDPSGIVKAWAMKKVEDAIMQQGYTTYMINAGGDIVCKSSTEKYWKIGISNPDNPDAAIGIIHADSIAVATSGTYQKGNHIYDPKENIPATGIKSVTVIGPDIISTDIYATALYAMGYKALQFAQTLGTAYKSIIIDDNNYQYSI